jgi:hypothetical protein
MLPLLSAADNLLLVVSIFEMQKIYETALPFFSSFGKLETGLRRLELHRSLPQHCNLGLYRLQSHKHDNGQDPVWKASLILDQLRRFEERDIQSAATPMRPTLFGELPAIPWLDQMEKQRAIDVLQTALQEDSVRTSHTLYEIFYSVASFAHTHNR